MKFSIVNGRADNDGVLGCQYAPDSIEGKLDAMADAWLAEHDVDVFGDEIFVPPTPAELGRMVAEISSVDEALEFLGVYGDLPEAVILVSKIVPRLGLSEKGLARFYELRAMATA